MEAKPGPESEQQDEDDNKETKEGTTRMHEGTVETVTVRY